MLLLHLLEFSAVRRRIPQQLAQLRPISKRLHTKDKSETCGTGFEHSALEKRAHTGTAHQWFDKLSGRRKSEGRSSHAEECGEVDGVEAAHRVELLLEKEEALLARVTDSLGGDELVVLVNHYLYDLNNLL